MKEHSYILYKKNLLNFYKKRFQKGFTIAELIVSSTISLTILLAGYYFTNIITQLNKNDSSQIKLFSKLDSAVDFILDEINSGKEILINKSQIKCTIKDKDRYGRLIAVCFSGKININAAMVREGWALAYRYYSKDYVNEEEIAKAKKKGIWQGSFIEPYIWRKNN